MSIFDGFDEWDLDRAFIKQFEKHYKSVEARNFRGTAFEYACSQMFEGQNSFMARMKKRCWELYP